MLSIVVFKWNRIRTGMQLPSSIDQYGAEHVNILYHSIQRNTTVPHRFICVTNDYEGLHPDIEQRWLWDFCRELGGCYNRLYIFSDKIDQILGPRFITIDLDCVVTGNIDHILNRTDDFIINEYDIKANRHASHQYYNGGIIMMDAGARKQVWDEFDPKTTPQLIQPRKDKVELVGSDQAWISHILGPGEQTFDQKDGVYDFRKLDDKRKLPENAAIVMFPGERDPLTEYQRYEWIRDHWRGSANDNHQVNKRHKQIQARKRRKPRSRRVRSRIR